MAKYTLICEHDEIGGSLKHVTEFRSNFLPDVLENFELFLRGCGFYFDGNVDIVSNENEYNNEEENDAWSTIVQSIETYSKQKQQEMSGSCNICGIPYNVMQGQKCYDANCPKV
jgi:hypothetical protein